MIRFAWIRFRTQAAVGAGLLAVVAVVFALTGLQLAHSYDAAVVLCKQQGNCASLFDVWPSNGYLTADNILGAIGLAVPGLIGMFWGPPLVTREFETGTFRLAWTQGVTRSRWLAAKLGIASLAAIAAAELFSLMANWWASPIHKANSGYTPFTGSSFTSGIAPAGYAVFAFALGVTAGLFIRHTLPAMAVTLAVFTAVIIVFPIWVRPHLIPPVRTTTAFAASAMNMQITNNMLLLQGAPPDVPAGSWVLSSGQVVNQAGRPVYSVPAQPCEGSAPSSPACTAYIAGLHLRQTVTYQPASRYWLFQGVETAIYLALALLLSGLCFLRIRPGRPAAPGISRPRASRPAPALESSP
jgi:ABC-2 family transporter protein